MTVTIRIPTALRAYAGQKARAEVRAATVGEALAALVAAHPELKPHLYEDDGKLRSFVNVYKVDGAGHGPASPAGAGRDVREIGGATAPVAAGDTLLIVPAVAGG